MVFPATPMTQTAELALGANVTADPDTWLWTDATSFTREADKVGYKIGRPDEARSVDPSECAFRLDNRDGRFTPRNPMGAYYGQLNKNTPVRIRVKPVEDTFARTASNGWDTSDSGSTWSTSGGSASDYSVSSGTGRISHSNTNVFRRVLAGRTLRNCEQLFDVSFPAVAAGGPIVVGALARYQDSSNYYWLSVEFNSAGTSVNAKVLKRVAGVDTTIASFNGPPTYSAGANTRIRAKVVGKTLAIKVWAASGSEPSSWNVSTTDETFTSAGNIGIQTILASGNSNTLPFVISLDNYTTYVDRFSGFVSKWPVTWDKSANDSTVEVAAYGVLGRLNQGTPASRSPLYRAISATDPLAYWPGEDGTVAASLASAVSGGSPLTVAGTAEFVAVADYVGTTTTDHYGSSSLVNLASGAMLSGAVTGTVTAATSTRWVLQIRADVRPAVIASDFVIAEWTTPGGTYARWRLLTLTTGTTRLIAYDSTGATTTLLNGGSVAGLGVYSVSAEQFGGNIVVRYSADTSYSTSVAGTNAGIVEVNVNPTRVTATDQVMVGHIAIWPLISAPTTEGTYTDSYGATVSSVNVSARREAATNRLIRLADEDGIPLSVPTVSSTFVERMGWQERNTPVTLYEQSEAADLGVLYEDGFGLGYLPRQYRYNRAVDMALDVNQGHLAEPPEPTDDDQQLTNQVTVKRTNGSSGIARDSDSITSVGLYESSKDVNHYDDTRLADFASWLVHLGTTEQMRWPRINLNLRASPELVDAWLSCGVGSRITIANPPDQIIGDDVDLIIEGYSETIGPYDWLVELNCSPAKPWDVAKADSSSLGRIDSGSSTLTSSVTSSATSFSVTTTNSADLWTTSAGDMPFDVLVGGEKMTVTAIASAVTDTFTRTVSNGWGTADSGQVWAIQAGTAANFSTTGNVGQIAINTVGSARRITMAGTYASVEARYKVAVPVLAVGDQIEIGLLTRFVDNSNFYESGILINTDATVTGFILRRLAGVGAFLTTTTLPLIHTAGRAYEIRASDSSGSLAVKVWFSGDAEPTGWSLTTSDTSFTSGLVGVVSALGSSNTNTLPVTLAFDNLAVTNPQIFTISARSVNGVVKAHSAGTEVHVANPAYLAL